MFALKALAMSLLTVARAGKWKRKWWVSGVRAGVAFLPAVGIGIGIQRLATDLGIGSDWRAIAVVAAPVLAYLALGGFFIDHVISRIGALMTWVVHIVWVLIVVGVIGVGWIVVAAFTSLDTGLAVTVTWAMASWGLPYMTVAFVLAKLVPGSFPKAKPWHENVRDVKAAYRRLRQRVADRRSPDAPRAQLPPPRPAKPPKAIKPPKPAKQPKEPRRTLRERRRALGMAASPHAPSATHDGATPQLPSAPHAPSAPHPPPDDAPRQLPPAPPGLPPEDAPDH